MRDKIMLKQENNPESRSQSAAQTRVTPDELVAAISRIEARQDAGHRQHEGTIEIGKAVQELALESTPEEVLAEVEAGRQQAIQARRGPSLAQRFVLMLGLGGILLGLGLGGYSLSQIQNQPAQEIVLSSNAPQTMRLDPDLLVGDTQGKLLMLSEVGDNQLVRCCYREGSFQQFQPGNEAEAWQLIKHGGQTYVRGWMPKMSPKVLLALGADLTAAENDPGFTVPITLAINHFKVVPGAGSTIEFHASDIHLDKHAWEKRSP